MCYKKVIIIYLNPFILFNLIIKSKKNVISLILLLLIYNIKFVILKNYKFYIINLNNFNSSFWDYVNILNSNNNSILIFTNIFLLIVVNIGVSKLLKSNIKFILLVLLNFVNYISAIQIHNLKYFLKISKIININLINGLIIIHPVYMYITYAFFIIVYFLYKKKIKSLNSFMFNLNNIFKKIILFSSLSLILGSY